MSPTHHGIIVGVDGSPAARVAVDWAAQEASLRHRPLTLLHVVPWASPEELQDEATGQYSGEIACAKPGASYDV